MQDLANEYREKGFEPYILPSSFHILGAIAYVAAAMEILEQTLSRNIKVDHLYLASAGATQVGLALGAKYLACPFKVTGINYAVHSADLLDRLVDLGNRTSEALTLGVSLSAADLPNESFAGAGYGILTPEAIEAIKLLATTEGLFLDPVYTAKGMAGLIAHIREGRIRSGQTVIFVHSGGLPALFAYSKELNIA
jgi:1-aminocyclopropane-1-carboxylate deaminase/D-cysteine desulfhydrase-like pyridoxal-dependent ACC family enzyme